MTSTDDTLWPADPDDRQAWSEMILKAFPAFVPMSAGHVTVKAPMTVASVNGTLEGMAALADLSGRPGPRLRDVAEFAGGRRAAEAAATLKTLLDAHGSDKANRHNFHFFYGAVLAARTEVSAVFEIGLGTNNIDVVSHMGADGRPGASLRAFRDFLPNARIFGADVDRRILFQEERIETFYVDQTDPASLAALNGGLPDAFDLIVDDGLHAPNANLTALTWGLPKLKPGGWLAIEDVAPAAEPVWRVAARLLPAGYEATLIRTNGRALIFAVQRTS